MSVFKMKDFRFYLQDAYVKDWIDNSMICLEVADVSSFWNQLVELNFSDKQYEVKIVPIKEYDWVKNALFMTHHEYYGILERLLFKQKKLQITSEFFLYLYSLTL